MVNVFEFALALFPLKVVVTPTLFHSLYVFPAPTAAIDVGVWTLSLSSSYPSKLKSNVV